MQLPRKQSVDDKDVLAKIISAIREKGYIVIDHVFTTEQLESLFVDIKQSDCQEFHQAGIGREQDSQLNKFIRRDRVRWLDQDYAPIRFYLDWIECLRGQINRELFLGLFEYECHFAHYPVGAYYRKHVDAFKGESNRVLTSILYLNPVWDSSYGGELMLYADDNETELEKVLPTLGRMVIFLSEDFPHEVLPAKQSRYSLTGWFRVNNTNGRQLDLPT